jgi:hypothetical protein
MTVVVGFLQWRILSTTEDTIKTDQRPWVGLSGIEPIPESSRVAAYGVTIANSGKSPALKADIQIIGGPGDCSKRSIPRERCRDTECIFRGIEILPQTSKTDRIPRIEESVWTPLVGPEYLACFIIRADYEDSYGKSHKTGICMTFSTLFSRTCPNPDSNYAD